MLEFGAASARDQNMIVRYKWIISFLKSPFLTRRTDIRNVIGNWTTVGSQPRKSFRVVVTQGSSRQFPSQKNAKACKPRLDLRMTPVFPRIRRDTTIRRRSMQYALKWISGGFCPIPPTGVSLPRQHACYNTGGTTNSAIHGLSFARSKRPKRPSG